MAETTCIKTEEGYRLSYKVCEIQGKDITIGFDGENPIVAGERMSRQNYRNRDFSEKQIEMLGIPSKKRDFFRSQLPSLTHLENVFQSKRKELKYGGKEDEG